ncbi:MAG: hypothetical protein ACRDUA_10985 [Micromonosporaceae bacterium]
MTLYKMTERPSVPPATAAALRVRPPFAGVAPAACPDTAVVSRDLAAEWLPVSPAAPRHRAGFDRGHAAATARDAGLLADNKSAVLGRIVSAPISGDAAQVQQYVSKQVNVGTTGVGGDPPRGRPI